MTNDEKLAFEKLKADFDTINSELETALRRVDQLTGYLMQITSGIDPARKASFEVIGASATSARATIKAINDNINKVLAPAS